MFRRRLHADLTGSAPLVVVHGGRFAGKTTLVRSWLMTEPAPGAVPVFVEAPARRITADQYRPRVLAALREAVATDRPDAAADLPALIERAGARRRPVILVLDGVDRVEGVADGIDELLSAAGTVRIVVTTRTARPWHGRCATGGGRIIAPDALAFTEHELSVFLRVFAVPQRGRATRTIMEHTGGLPALVWAVCRALRAMPPGERACPESLGAVVERAVDLLIVRTIVSDPDVPPFFRPLRTATAPDADPASVAARGLVETLESSGLAECGDDGRTSVFPAAVQRSLARSAAAGRIRPGGTSTDTVAGCDARDADSTPIPDDRDPAARHVYGICCLHLGTTHLLAGRTGDAAVMLRRAHAAGAGSFVRRQAAGTLALVRALDGSVPEARHRIGEEETRPAAPDAGDPAAGTASLIAASLAALDRLDPGGAPEFLTVSGAPPDDEELWAFVLYARGQHALLTAMPADGLRHIEAEMQRCTRPAAGMPGVLLDTVRAELCLALGDAEQARRLVAAHTHPLAAVVEARTRLLTGDSGIAEAMVHRHARDPACSPRVSLELSVIGAAAAAVAGRRAEARRQVTRAVTLSRQSGIVRSFVGLAPSMIEDIAALGVELPVDPASLAPELVAYRRNPSVIRLTPREREVLDALVAGGTVGTIARAQFVSPNTVKTQLQSLYRKLGVHSRKDAIAAARHLASE